jgi:hypothetical protein
LESELDKRARTVLKTDRSVMSWLGGRTYTLRNKNRFKLYIGPSGSS